MKTLTKFFATAAAAAAIASFAVPASAATFVMNWSDDGLGGIGLAFGDDAINSATGAGFYGPGADAGDGTSFHTNSGGGAFTDTFTFVLPFGSVGFSLTSLSFTAASSTFFDSISFGGTPLTWINTPTGPGSNYAVAFTGAALPVAGGVPITLTVTGHGGANAVWTGTGSFAAGAVPEPATWGLMIMGFGGVGALLRGRRRQAVAFA